MTRWKPKTGCRTRASRKVWFTGAHRGLGTSRILGELKQHALNPALVEEASAQLRETELARAQAVWFKKFGQLPQTPAERAKQARFLASRGFSGATIGKILKGIDDIWDGD
ncbi:SOS response regulatory protein OraA/RecX [Paraburkholderia youngii]